MTSTISRIIDQGQTEVIINPERQTIEYYDITDPKGPPKLKFRVLIEMSMKDGDLIFNQDNVTIEYYSDQKHLQAKYVGSVRVYKNLASDDFPLIFKQNIGSLERYKTPTQFALTMAGQFDGSIRLQRGALILHIYDLVINTHQVIYLTDERKQLSDLLFVEPTLKTTDNLQTPHLDYLYQLAAVKEHDRPCLSLKAIINNLSRGHYEHLIDQYAKILRQCHEHGKKVIRVHDQVIQKSIVEGLCQLVFLEAITAPESNTIPQLFDQFLTQQVKHAIEQEKNLLEPT